MRKKSNKQSQTKGDIDISFVKQNKQMTIQENRLNVEILRVHTIEKQRMVSGLFSMPQQQLCQFFSNYQLFPYGQQFNIVELLQSNKLKLIKNDDKIYFGQVERKRRQGKGINITKDGKIYEGQFYNNQKNGHGVEIYANGNLYTGLFENGKKHGDGHFFWFNLSSKNPKEDQYVEYYQGSWWGGLPDGEGIHQKINGDIYTGHFKNGLKHGEGVEHFSNGDIYKGQYVNGLPQGYGEYIWFDKSCYKGDFKQGLRNGYGVWTQGVSAQRYKGHYLMDKKSGYGVYQWQNGWVYKGNFDNDFRNGFGELYNDKGKMVYRGFWQAGQQTDKQITNNNMQFSSKGSNIFSKSEGRRTMQSTQKMSRTKKIDHRLYQHSGEDQNPERGFGRSKNKSASKIRKHAESQWMGELAVKTRGSFTMKQRPQSFNANTRKSSLTQRKFSRSNNMASQSSRRPTDGHVGSSISRPINRNYGTLYVPYPPSIHSRNMF